MPRRCSSARMASSSPYSSTMSPNVLGVDAQEAQALLVYRARMDEVAERAGAGGSGLVDQAREPGVAVEGRVHRAWFWIRRSGAVIICLQGRSILAQCEGPVRLQMIGPVRPYRGLATRGGPPRRLEGAIRDAIRSGRLQPSDPLPSSRALAADLGLARGTVAEAYAQLAAEGYLTARPGAPDAGRRRRAGARRTRPAGAATAAARAAALRPRGRRARRWRRSRARRGCAALRRALRDGARRTRSRYGDPRGRPSCARRWRATSRRTRGVVADPGRIVVTLRLQRTALALLCRALRDAPGSTRSPWRTRACTTTAPSPPAPGLRVAPLAVDDDGAARRPAGRRAGAVLLTPAHQFPLGVTLAPARRRRWSPGRRPSDGLIVEDDYDGEFRYDRQPVGALQGLAPGARRLRRHREQDARARPAARLARAAAAAASSPSSPRSELLAAEHVGDRAARRWPSCSQSGAYDRHVRRMRLRYRRRRDALLELLAAARAGARRRAASRRACTSCSTYRPTSQRKTSSPAPPRPASA